MNKNTAKSKLIQALIDNGCDCDENERDRNKGEYGDCFACISEAALNEYEQKISSYVRTLRILLGHLADLEIKIDDDASIVNIANCLYDEDKRLAQNATACLDNCCGSFGQDLIQKAIKENPPHTTLIKLMLRVEKNVPLFYSAAAYNTAEMVRNDKKEQMHISTIEETSVDETLDPRRKFTLRRPLEILVYQKFGFWWHENKKLNINAYGDTKEESFEAFCTEFVMLWDKLALAQFNTLTKDAIDLKRIMLELVLKVERII